MNNLNINLYIEYTKCNMNCPYCYVKDTRRDVDSRTQKYMDKIPFVLASLPYNLTLAIEQNGDALISEKMLDFIITLSSLQNIKAVNFNTNLSASIDELKVFLQKANTDTLTLCCTYHQHVYKDYEGFKEKLRLLKSFGVSTVVIMVAYPRGMEKLAYFKKEFDALGTPLSINALGGKYKDKIYPFAYTKEEREYLREIFYSQAAYEYNLERKKTKGIECTSGVKSIAIDRKGDVYACRQDWMKSPVPYHNNLFMLPLKALFALTKPIFVKNHLGNIFKGFTLLDSHTCPHETCNCARDFHTTAEFCSKYEKTKHLRIYKSK